MIKTDLYSRRGQFMLGQHVVHSWAELYFIEQVLHKHHFDSLIEIGTYEGGLSLFLGLHALRMNAKALTLDIKPEPLDKGQGFYGKLKPLLPLEFAQLDALSPEAQKLIKNYIDLGRAFLYCDGAKAEAFNLYAPTLKPQDVIMAHDRGNQIAKEKGYAREIWDKDIKDTVQKYGLEPFYDEGVNQLGGIFSFIKGG